MRKFQSQISEKTLKFLQAKAKFVKIETLKLHKIAPSTRISSSLSCVEILTTLYYANFIKFNPKNPYDKNRDRVIISKGHGSICLYPILADFGFFDQKELKNIGKNGSFLGTIPEPTTPGYESVNGSLGHGLGVGCGVALAEKSKNVIVLCGDGELMEGSCWEAVMFASKHCLENLSLIVDNNKASMLGFTKDILNIEPLHTKFHAFGWDAIRINGHEITQIYTAFKEILNKRNKKPKIIIADTIKGKGVKRLENHPLSHILSLKADEINEILKGLEND